MAFGNLGKVIAGQALETAKKNVLDGLLSPETAKSAEKISSDRPTVAPPGEPLGNVILGQVQAMQRALTEEQELLVLVSAGTETLRVLQIFVPSPQVLVLAGVDEDQNVTRLVIPVETAQLVCKVMKVAEGAKPIRVNVMTPRPPNAPIPSR